MNCNLSTTSGLTFCLGTGTKGFPPLWPDLQRKKGRLGREVTLLKVMELLNGGAEIQTQGWLHAGQDQLVIQQFCKQQLKLFKGIMCLSSVDR